MINKSRIATTLCELVQIDSPSGEEKKISQNLRKRLRYLGGKVTVDNYGNIIAKFSGEGKPFLLGTHMDTVEPGRGVKPQILKDKITSDGTTILGGDPKAGISVILEALTSLTEDKRNHHPLEIIFTREEESCLGGSANLDYSKLSAKQGIIFDGDQGVHRIFISSPWYYNINATIKGRSAHAGMEPEKGISAIQIAAKIISQLELGRIDFETTSNIGIINGGSAINAVPEEVEIKGEVRSRDKKKLFQQISKIEKTFQKILKQYPEAKLDLSMTEEFSGFKLDKSHATVKLASELLHEMSIEPDLIDCGGGSDANILHTHGIEVIVVGTGVWEEHTKQEYVLIPQLLEAAQFCEQIIRI